MNRVKLSVISLLIAAHSLCYSVSPVEFQKATLNGDTEIVEQGLKEKSYEYVRLRDKSQNTPLHLACSTRKGGTKSSIIALLIKYGADVNAVNKHFSTPLQIAVASNNLEGAQILLKHPTINVNKRNVDDRSPLLSAIINRNTQMMNLLLSHPEINPNAQNIDGMAPLHFTAMWGFVEESEILINFPQTNPYPKQTQGNFIGATPLHYGAMQAHPEIVALFLKQKGMDINLTITEGIYEGFSPLHFAVMNHNTPQVFDTLKLLFEAGFNPQIKTKSGKAPEDLTSVKVILKFLENPDPSYELRKKQ